MSFIKDTFFGGAEEDAAEIQARSGERAIDVQERALERAREDVAPFRQAGQTALNPLVEFAGNYDPSVERENIIRDVSRTAAARGKLGSGGTLKELGRQLYGLQQQNRSQRFNELFNLATLGSNAASRQATSTIQTGRGVANTRTGIGNALASGEVGSANSTRNTLFSILSAVMG